jgi:hypothetical protein
MIIYTLQFDNPAVQGILFSKCIGLTLNAANNTSERQGIKPSSSPRKKQILQSHNGIRRETKGNHFDMLFGSFRSYKNLIQGVRNVLYCF